VPDPPSRRYPFRPLLGVAALIFDHDSILLVERGAAPLKGYWSLPGGLVETGERLDAAMRREAREETGLEVRPLSILEVFERILLDADGKTEYHFVVIDYVCEAIGGELRAASDATRVCWVGEAELSGYSITPGTVPVIEKGFRQRK
jgi:8-oxo-dGTP diphosphatase